MRIFLMLLAVTFFAACAGGENASSGANVSLYKYIGSAQCSGGGTPLAAMKRQLIDAGIQVHASACGGDGKFYPAVCGASDGRIGIFDIAPPQVPAASTLGFAPLSSLPSATKTACP